MAFPGLRHASPRLFLPVLSFSFLFSLPPPFRFPSSLLPSRPFPHFLFYPAPFPSPVRVPFRGGRRSGRIVEGGSGRMGLAAGILCA